MAFESFSEFVAMGKHGFYVWLVYGVSLATLLTLVGLSVRRYRRALKGTEVER